MHRSARSQLCVLSYSLHKLISNELTRCGQWSDKGADMEGDSRLLDIPILPKFIAGVHSHHAEHAIARQQNQTQVMLAWHIKVVPLVLKHKFCWLQKKHINNELRRYLAELKVRFESLLTILHFAGSYPCVDNTALRQQSTSYRIARSRGGTSDGAIFAIFCWSTV